MTGCETLEEPQTAEHFDKKDIWCLEQQADPDWALCGARLFGPIIPRAEVPEEQICLECRRLHALGAR